MPALPTHDTPSQYTVTIHPPTLDIIAPTPCTASFQASLDQTKTFPTSSPYEPNLQKFTPSSSKPTLSRPLPPVSPFETELCTTSACVSTSSTTSYTMSSVSASPVLPSPLRKRCKSLVCSEIERRPGRGDDCYIKRPENAFVLFRRKCCEARQAAQEDATIVGGPLKKQRQADLSKTISQQWKTLSPEERLHREELAKEKKKEHEQMYPNYVYRPQRTKDWRGKKGECREEDSETTISVVLPLCAPTVGKDHASARLASVPTASPRQTNQIPRVYMHSCPASPSMIPTMTRRTSYSDPGSSLPSQFTPAPSITAGTASQQQYPSLQERLESLRSRFSENYYIAPLREAVGCDVTCVAISTKKRHGLPMSDLLKAKREDMFKHDIHKAQHDVALIAQRSDIEAKIKMSIAVGKKLYQQNFQRGAFFRGRTLKERLDVIRRDIITIWELYGWDHCLTDDKLIEALLPVDVRGDAGASQSTVRARMAQIKLDDPRFISSAVSELVNLVIAILRMPYETYQQTIHDIEIFISYIVNLICVMQVIFLLVPDRLVTHDTVDRAINVCKDKREQLQITMRNFTEKQALRTLGQDQVLEVIESLIWQYNIPEQTAEESRQESERLGQASPPSSK